MASVESIEPQETEYRVPAWVRVRQEDFGLLFYDTKSTKLTFVRSGSSLTHRSLLESGQQTDLVAFGRMGGRAEQQAVDRLVARGLLLERHA